MKYDEIKRRDRKIFNTYTKPDIFHSSAIAKKTFEEMRAWMIARILSHPRYAGGLNILEVGCGGGFNVKWLGDYGGRIMGIDHSMGRLKTTKPKFDDTEKFQFVLADGEMPPFKNNTLDIVFCSSVLHHLPNYEMALASYNLALADQGLVITTEPCAFNPFAVIRRKFFPAETHTPDERPFPPKELIEEFKKHYDNVQYRRFHLFSVNSPLVETLFGLRVAELYFKIFSQIDRLLLKIPVIKEMCWNLCLVGQKKIKSNAG